MKNIPIRKINVQKEAFFSESFSIRNVSELLNGNDLFHKLHRHDFFFILALQKGEGNHEIDFIEYKLQDNSIFILRPGQVHQLELKASCKGFLLAFDTTFYNPNIKQSNWWLGRAGNKNLCEFEQNRFKKLHTVLSSIFDEFSANQEGYIEVIKANLDIFFIEFIRQSKNTHDTSKINTTYAQERLDEFLEQLGKHITKLKQVYQYADLLNLSIYQLNSITKSTLGKPASELINEQIILEAKRYLLATPNQVKDIADYLGYEDISYFIRFFKKHTGFSPETFRKNSNKSYSTLT